MVTRQRSPNYPGIDLAAAIEASQDLYRQFQRREFTVSDAAATWGYTSPSGPVRVKLAALRQYDLIDGKKGGNPRLSRLALTFALRNRASREYFDALKQAAIAPPLIGEVLRTKEGVSDDAIREYLVLDRNFTDDGAQKFVDVYKATVRLANLTDDDTMPGLNEDESWNDSEDNLMVIPPSGPASAPGQEVLRPSGAHTRVPLQLMGGSLNAVVELPTSMTERAWQQMIDMLNALKPGYVPEADYGPSDEVPAGDLWASEQDHAPQGQISSEKFDSP